MISRDAAGRILVANTSLIEVFGLGGQDVITLSEVNGALPAAKLLGGAANDTLTGGSGGDQLFGQAGNDTLLGRGGFDPAPSRARPCSRSTARSESFPTPTWPGSFATCARPELNSSRRCVESRVGG